MTADQLWALARRERQSAAAADAAADALHGAGAELDGLMKGVAGWSRSAWAGPAADGFERLMAGEQVRVDRHAASLRGHARALWSEASSLRASARRHESEADRLDAMERSSAAGSVLASSTVTVE